MDQDGLIKLMTDVIAALQNLKDDNLKPVFRKVTIYNNQIQKAGLQNDFDNKTAVKNIAEVNDWPACFIEPVVDQVNSEGLGTQMIIGRLLIHICTYRLDIDKNWQYPFQLRTMVHQTLHMLKEQTDRYSTLIRSQEAPDTDHDTLYNWISTYAFEIVDESAYVYRNSPTLSGTAGIAINPRIVTSL